MSVVSINPRTLALVVGTRAALAFGIGLLVAEHVPASKRRTLALTLIGIGAITTVPLAREVLGGWRRQLPRGGDVSVGPDPEAAPM
jgi:hypothetical protein